MKKNILFTLALTIGALTVSAQNQSKDAKLEALLDRAFDKQQARVFKNSDKNKDGKSKNKQMLAPVRTVGVVRKQSLGQGNRRSKSRRTEGRGVRNTSYQVVVNVTKHAFKHVEKISDVNNANIQ